MINSDQGSPRSNSTSRERDIVKKGIKRLEKQILQLISVLISGEQVDIVLLKKCKTVDVPAVNSAIGNVQKALQKYIGFDGTDLDVKWPYRTSIQFDESLLSPTSLWRYAGGL